MSKRKAKLGAPRNMRVAVMCIQKYASLCLNKYIKKYARVFEQIYAGWHANATASVKEAMEADFGMNWKQFVGT